MNIIHIINTIQFKREADKCLKKFEEKPYEPTDLESYEMEFNSLLFGRFYRDLERNTLPVIPRPTASEIEDYKIKKEKRCSKSDNFYKYLDWGKAEANNSIPIEVEIWVDKIFDIYFKDLFPVFGQVHKCYAIRKKLYRYKGYNWYSFRELHPGVRVD